MQFFKIFVANTCTVSLILLSRRRGRGSSSASHLCNLCAPDNLRFTTGLLCTNSHHIYMHKIMYNLCICMLNMHVYASACTCACIYVHTHIIMCVHACIYMYAGVNTHTPAILRNCFVHLWSCTWLSEPTEAIH